MCSSESASSVGLASSLPSHLTTGAGASAQKGNYRVKAMLVIVPLAKPGRAKPGRAKRPASSRVVRYGAIDNHVVPGK